MSDGVSQVSPHWSFWPIAGIAVLWNSFGSYDFLMTQTQGAAYLEQMLTPEQVEDYMNMPAWATFAWGTAILTSILGSLALLFRMRWAVPLFAVSLAGMLLSFFHQLVLIGEIERSGIGAAIFPAIIVAIGVFLLSYSIRQSQSGVLR